MNRVVATYVGAEPRSPRSGRTTCLRCGRDIQISKNPEQLNLCRGCRHDSWFIEQITRGE